MTLAGTLELIERARARPAGGRLQLPQPDSALRGRSLPARRRRPGRGGRAPHRPPGGQRSRRRVGPPGRARSTSSGWSPRRPVPTGWPRRSTGAQGFVYLVARLGVTGASRRRWRTGWRTSIARVRRATPLPVAVGFGISTPAQARTRGADRPTAWWSGARWSRSLGRDGVAAARRFLAVAPRGARRAGAVASMHGPSCQLLVDRYAQVLSLGGVAAHGRGARGGPRAGLAQPVATLVLIGGGRRSCARARCG